MTGERKALFGVAAIGDVAGDQAPAQDAEPDDAGHRSRATEPQRCS